MIHTATPAWTWNSVLEEEDLADDLEEDESPESYADRRPSPSPMQEGE